MRLIFTPGTSQPQRVYSCNFFLSFNRLSSQGFVTSNSEVVGCLFKNNLTWTDEGKDTKDKKERTGPNWKNSLTKPGANARWSLGSWLNYCLNYICSDQTKLFHSMLTFICTTGRYLTIISWARVGYEMVNSQRGAPRRVGYNQSHIQKARIE